jgi:ATP-dependent Clp protease ATP-binding subunit ClpB
VDEVVEFKSLEMKNMTSIVQIQLKDFIQRLAEKQITVEVGAAVYEWLATRGFDPQFGARPLRRLIQSEILNPLAKKLIAQEIKSGQTVVLDIQDQKIDFKIKSV